MASTSTGTKVRKSLAEDEPALALAREWCGEQAAQEYDELRVEVMRLRRLIEDTADWINEHGNPQKAVTILKQLNRPGN